MSKLPPPRKPQSLPAVPGFDLALPDKPAPLDIANFDDLSKRVAHAQKLLKYRDRLLKIQTDIDRYDYGSSNYDFYTEFTYHHHRLSINPNFLEDDLKNQRAQLKMLMRTAMVQIVAIQLASVDADLRALNVGL